MYVLTRVTNRFFGLVFSLFLPGEKPAAMQHPNKNPTATSGARPGTLPPLTAYRCGWLRPVRSWCPLLAVSLLPATVSLVATMLLTMVGRLARGTGQRPGAAGPTPKPSDDDGRRPSEPYLPVASRRRQCHRTALLTLCILTALLLSVKTIFSKSIKLFDVV